jgi:UDP-N-acetylmuramoyl-L-alanyl-D-glutamate--2,6-diaminopimelate ligase
MKFSALIGKLRERGGEVVRMHAGMDPEILGVCDDSRKAKAGDLFVARAGVKADGAKFIEDAIGRGAVAVVTSGQWPVAGGQKEVAWAQVGDANLACALLAHEVGGRPTAGMKVIGVTGTKGKTTVAYLLRSVLRAAGHTVGMVGTVEIDDGREAVPADMTTPGSVELARLFSRMKANGVTHCVMEVSSHALHQHRVAGIEFAVGIFTNLTGDHLDYHKTMEEYAAAKAVLFERMGETATAVINADDSWARRMVQGCRAKVIPLHVELDTHRAGTMETAARAEAGWSGLVTQMDSGGMWINLGGPVTFVPGMEKSLPFMYKIHTPLVGKHNAYNILCAVAGAYALGLTLEQMRLAVAALLTARGAPGRLQRVEVTGQELPFQVFVDYAHTHDALENVLKALRATMGGGKLICVFGCGGDRDRTKRPKMGRVAETLADRVIVTSDNPRTEDPAFILGEICAGFSEGWQGAGKVTVEADRRAAIRAAIEMAGAGDVVLIAGKGHENYQIIGTTKSHFDDVEEAAAAIAQRLGAKVGT